MPLEVKSGHRAGILVRNVSGNRPGLHLPSSSRLTRTAPDAARPAVFLDRDGVIVRDVHYLRRPDQIEVLPGVDSLRRLQDRFYLIVATNQSGIARGLFSEEDLLSIHSELVARLKNDDVIIDAFYYCPHLTNCDCRKPGTGMFAQAAADWPIPLAASYMIGDSLRDIEAGRAAGLAGSILLGGSNDSSHCRSAATLEDAVNLILEMQADV